MCCLGFLNRNMRGHSPFSAVTSSSVFTLYLSVLSVKCACVASITGGRVGSLRLLLCNIAVIHLNKVLQFTRSVWYNFHPFQPITLFTSCCSEECKSLHSLSCSVTKNVSWIDFMNALKTSLW